MLKNTRFLSLSIFLMAAGVVCASPVQGTPKNAAPTFEGRFDVKITTEGATGALQLGFTPAAARVDMDMRIDMLPIPLRFSALMRHQEPNRLYLLNDAQKTFTELDSAQLGKMFGSRGGEGDVEVTVIGKETMLGYGVTRVKAKGRNGSTELWITKEIDVYSVYKRLQAANPQLGGELAILEALESKGLQGLPLKTVAVRDGQKVVMEVTRVERVKLPATGFEIPADYTKAPMGMSALQGGPSAEQLKNMQRMVEGLLDSQRTR